MSRVTTRSQHVEDNCCICLEDMNRTSMDNPIKVLPCGHELHQYCFNQHRTRSYLCPLCRKNLYNGFVRLSNDSTTEEIKEAIVNKIIKPDLNTWETEARTRLNYGYSPTGGAFGLVVRNGILNLMDKVLDQPQWLRNRLIEGYNECLIDTDTPLLDDFRGYLLDGPEGDCNMYLKLNIIVWILRSMSIKDGEVFYINNPDNYNYANELTTYINNFFNSVDINRLDPQYRQEFEEFFSPMQPMQPGLIFNHFHWISHVWNNNLKERKVQILNGEKITLEEIRTTLLTVTAFNHFQKIYPYFILWLIAKDGNKQKVISDLYQECSGWIGDSNLGGNCKKTRKSKRKKSKKRKSRKLNGGIPTGERTTPTAEPISPLVHAENVQLLETYEPPLQPDPSAPPLQPAPQAFPLITDTSSDYTNARNLTHYRRPIRRSRRPSWMGGSFRGETRNKKTKRRKSRKNRTRKN